MLTLVDGEENHTAEGKSRAGVRSDRRALRRLALLLDVCGNWGENHVETCGANFPIAVVYRNLWKFPTTLPTIGR